MSCLLKTFFWENMWYFKMFFRNLGPPPKTVVFSKASAADTEVSLWHFLMCPPPPSIIYWHELHVSRQVLQSRLAFLHSLNHSLEYWSHEGSATFPSPGIKPRHHSSDWSHSLLLSPRSQFHSKGQGDRLAAACLMHMDDRRSICSSAECKYTSLFLCSLFLPQRATLPDLTWHQFHLLVAEWRFILNHNRNASHCHPKSPTQPPAPPQLILTLSCLITCIAMSEN